MQQVFVEFGETVTLEMPFSEVCMHMRIAGTVMQVRLQAPHGYANAQLIRDGQEFSFPITPGEAGFYFEEGRGYYCYPVEIPADHILLSNGRSVWKDPEGTK
jgi:hypothetical protein